MNKAYLLVICLIATTLTGCIGDQQPLYDDGDEKIEPVGMDEGDQNDGKNSTYDKNTTYSNITIRYYDYYTNFSKMGNTVHVTFDAPFRFDDFIWFMDYSGNEIRHNHLYGGFDNCYSNGNWSAWDSNGSADCIETYELENSNGALANSTSVIWEYNLAREPMSVAIGYNHGHYFLESF